MEERGRLIRTDLVREFRERLPILGRAFDPIFDDLAVEGSDGIGRKTEAPWVRLFSRAMSPNPREGFYVVIHFAADGSAIFITVGCGSTVLKNGFLRSVSDSELEQRTEWARDVVTGHWGTTEPFSDVMSLGAKAPLPRTFEKATAIALRIKTSELSGTDLDWALVQAAERLSSIYLAQLENRDISPGDLDVAEIAQIARPLRTAGARQGFGLSAAERRAIELRAMHLALEHLRGEGFTCEDTSASSPFDILATRGSETLKVEVKGTTSDRCDSVLMTRNEVRLHQEEKGRTALIIVSRIRLRRPADGPFADEGTVEVLLRWNIDLWDQEPIAYQVSRQGVGRALT